MNQFQIAAAEKRAVKVIAGIDNFDLAHVLKVVRAAEAAGAQAVDVAARPEIVRAVREATDLTVFASSVVAEELAAAAEAGADVVEVGNYDAMYKQNQYLSLDEALELARRTMALVAGKARVSVTIPGHLTLESQQKMARELETMGVDYIQTEGHALTVEPEMTMMSAEEKAALTFKHTEAIVAVTPTATVMTASGITADNAHVAFASGASAIGVGSFVNKLADEAEMTARMQALMTAIAERKLVAAR